MNRNRADSRGATATGAGARGPGSSLREALDALGDGCSLLVTGDVPTDAHRVAAARYFGDPAEPRRRVLGLTHDTPRPAAWLPGAVTAESDHTEVVRMDDALRDPSAVSGSPTSDGGFTPADGGGFPNRFLDAIERVADADVEEGDGDGDCPADMRLRVGLFRVDGLRAAIGEAEAGRLLHEAAATTRARGGMAHFHLPRRSTADDDPRADPLVDDVATQLGEALDVNVELRLRDRAVVPEERWHIEGWGSTDWHPLG